MKLKSSILKPIFFLLTVVFLFQACGPKEPVKTTPFVVVRGSELRSEIILLPLDEEAISGLLDYIKKGGDTKGTGPVDFYNESYYRGLLKLFTSDADNDGKFELEDLFDDVEGERTFKSKTAKYFTGGIGYSVIDSRGKRPSKKSYRPFFLMEKEGNLWWIFYRKKGDVNHITGLMVTVPLFKKLRHFEK